jgi:RNA polymerase sigma factor (sigma-70 family)
MTRNVPTPVLQLIRQLVEDPRFQKMADEELIGRFCTSHDEEAFQALVKRHGSMVLEVSRSVLGNDADAEDAFQATFLVLAQKASAIRKGESIGSWLYGVAYRTALNAQRISARRKKHESLGSDRRAAEAAGDLAWPELQHILYEELTRIARCYQAPLVLCYLEGMAQDRAAAVLGVSKATLRKRLDHGRALLRSRLVRRGLGPVAVLLAAVWPLATARALPAAQLVSSTVRAATQIAAGPGTVAGSVSTRVAALAEGVLKTMQSTKSNVVAAVLLALALIAGAGSVVVSCHALAADQTGTSSEALANQASTDRDASGKDAQPQIQPLQAQVVPVRVRPATPEGDDALVKGRVLGPDGKPFKGAKLFVITRNARKAARKAKGTTGADGCFKVVVAPADLTRGAKLVATAGKHGPDWVELGKADGRRELTLRLVKDDVPIKGRLLDLEGRPLAGVAVQVLSLAKPIKDGDLKLWIENAKLYARWVSAGKALGVQHEEPMTSISPAGLGLPALVKSGKDGTFRLTGFGRERVVGLAIRAKNLEYADLSVLTTRIKLGKEPLAAPPSVEPDGCRRNSSSNSTTVSACIRS